MKKLILMIIDEKSALIEQLCAAVALKVGNMKLPDAEVYLHVKEGVQALTNEYTFRYKQGFSLGEYKELFPEEYEQSYGGTLDVELLQAKRDVLFKIIEQTESRVVGLAQLKAIRKGIVISALSAKELEDNLALYKKLFGEEGVIVIDKGALSTVEDIERQASTVTAKLFPHISRVRPVEELDEEEFKIHSPSTPSKFPTGSALIKHPTITWDKKTIKKFIKDNCRAFLSEFSIGSEEDMHVILHEGVPIEVKKAMIKYLAVDIESDIKASIRCNILSKTADEYKNTDLILYRSLNYLKEIYLEFYNKVHDSLNIGNKEYVDKLMSLTRAEIEERCGLKSGSFEEIFSFVKKVSATTSPINVNGIAHE
jgi:hypothetical protein